MPLDTAPADTLIFRCQVAVGLVQKKVQDCMNRGRLERTRRGLGQSKIAVNEMQNGRADQRGK